MRVSLLAALVSSAVSVPVFASDVKITPVVDVKYTASEIESGDSEATTSDINTLTIAPSVALSYTSKKIRTTLSANHNYFDRDIKDDEFGGDSLRDNYTNYRLVAEVTPIDKVLNIGINATQRYRNPDITNSLVNDNRALIDELAKTNNRSVYGTFTLPNPTYVGFQLTGQKSNIESDRTFSGVSRSLDSDSTAVSAALYSGDAFDSVQWSVNSSKTETESLEQGRNYTTQQSNANMSFGLFSDIRFVMKGFHSDNDFGVQQSFNRQSGEYSSVGAGFSWSPASSRFIELTYNQADELDDETKNYVGLNLAWRISPRTSVKATLDRRFYGRSGSFSFNYKARRWRASVNYDEQVSSFSRLIQTGNNVELFVCPQGSLNINECFIPDTLDYELGAGESFVNYIEPLFDINDQVRLRKQLGFSIGYKLRRLSFALSGQHSESNTTLDSDVDLPLDEYVSDNIRLTAGIRLGAKTALSYNINYLETERSLGDNVQDYESLSSGITVNYALGKQLSAVANINYSDRKSEIQQDYTDKSISIGLNYRFR